MPHSKYNSDIHNEIVELVKKGAPYDKICEKIGIAESTFYNWLNPKHPSFRLELMEDMKKARDEWKRNSTIKLVNRMYERAMGFGYEEKTHKLNPKTNTMELVETKTKYICSDTLAVFLACNHDSENYQQRNVIDQKLRGNINYSNFDVELTPEEEAEYKQRLKDFWGEDVIED